MFRYSILFIRTFMKQANKLTGGAGERAAETYLVKKGYELVTRNFCTRLGEIDLIMNDGNILVFIEVKTKKGQMFGTPEEMFTRGKYNQVKRMATLYLNGKAVPCRIDMVAVDLDDTGESKIRHYENVT